MEHTRVISWYVARRVDAPVDVVAASFDHLAESQQIDVSGDAGRLTLAPAPIAFTPYPGAPRRRLRGRLAPAGRHVPVPVEVEVTAWSQASAEIGLRPTGRLPRGRRAVGYFDAALDTLSELGSRVTARVPLRLVLDERLERAS
jgi:hypothetical protein